MPLSLWVMPLQPKIVSINRFLLVKLDWEVRAVRVADTSIKFPISSAQNTKVFGFAGLSATYQLSSSTTVYAKYEANTMNSNDSISNNATVEFKTSF